MKKTFLGILFLVVSFAHAQSDPGFGIKAGLNYGGTGDITDSAEQAYQDPSSDIGYHVGVFGRAGRAVHKVNLRVGDGRSAHNVNWIPNLLIVFCFFKKG